MRTGLGKLIVLNLAQHRRHFFFAGFGIVAGIGAFVFFVALGQGIKRVVFETIFADLPWATVEVTPKSANLGFLRLAGNLFGGSAITEDDLAALGKIPGVARTGGQINLAVPLMARGNLFGRGMRTDLVATGIDPWVVEGDIQPGQKFAYPPPEGEAVPALVSTHLLELYNSTFAEQMNLPKLAPQAAVKIDFELVVGRSYIQGDKFKDKVREHKVRLAGMSPRAVLVGITLPADFVKHELRRLLGSDTAIQYAVAYVEARSQDDLGAVTAAIEAMGFDVDRDRKAIGGAINLATAVMGLLAMLIVFLAAVNIAHTYFMLIYQRRRELGILRAVGATRAHVRTMVLGEAAVLGTAAGVSGVLLARLAAWITDIAAARIFTRFPYHPESFFDFTALAVSGGLGFAILFSLAGAFFPAVRAARLDPARALAED